MISKQKQDELFFVLLYDCPELAYLPMNIERKTGKCYHYLSNLHISIWKYTEA